MHSLYELKEKLCDELEEYGRQELTANSLDVIDKLAHAAKNVCKVIESCEDEEYSGNMMGGRSYGYRGRSYARRSRDMRGRYSGTDYPDGMMDNTVR